MYSSEPYEKCALIHDCVEGKNCAIVGGNAITAAAKKTGMTPAMFTRSGRQDEPPAGWRAPPLPVAHRIRVRRGPPSMKTTAAIMPRAISAENRHAHGAPV